MIFMEQISKCEYSSLSCFLQLSDIDANCDKSTTPVDAIFRDISVLNLYYEILRIVEKDPLNTGISMPCEIIFGIFTSFLNICQALFQA